MRTKSMSRNRSPLPILLCATLVACATVTPDVSANESESMERVWQETTLVWDDGLYNQMGHVVTGQVGMAIAVEFQKPEWVTHLLGMKLYVVNDNQVNPEDPYAPTTAPFLARAWTWVTGLPGSPVLAYVPFDWYAYQEDMWVTFYFPNPIDLSSDTQFPDGKFFVGLEWLYRNNPIIAFDSDTLGTNSLRWNWMSWEASETGVYMIRAIVGVELPLPGEAIYVDLDGGADYLTIQEGLNAASDRDTVYVAPGTYTGSSNRDLTFGGKQVVLKSQSGRAATIVDCQGLGRAFYLADGEGEDTIIEGFTVRNGLGSGGAVRCVNAWPTIRDCVFDGNDGESWGGAMFLTNPTTPSPAVEGCVFANNTASASGGAVRLDYSEPVFRNCTFCLNGAPDGGAVSCGNLSFPSFENCIFALSTEDVAISCPDGSVPSITHSCVFANAGGDSLCGTHWANLFVDPALCDPERGDYHLQEGSPCLPEGNAWGELVGACGAGCSETLVKETSWGRIKSLYR